MEGDDRFQIVVNLIRDFNPLPPHGGRLDRNLGRRAQIAFQSTPSAWRETYPFIYHTCIYTYFNPLPPHGGRQDTLHVTIAGLPFQSTPSAWRETHVLQFINGIGFISIHSLRMEGDLYTSSMRLDNSHFNPLPPHGGRQIELYRRT